MVAEILGKETFVTKWNVHVFGLAFMITVFSNLVDFSFRTAYKVETSELFYTEMHFINVVHSKFESVKISEIQRIFTESQRLLLFQI